MSLFSNLDPLKRFSDGYNSKTRLTILTSAVGLILFVVIATMLPFKDQLFNYLYPKPKSQAQEQSQQNQEKPKFRGYLVEFKDDSVMEYKRKTQPEEKINRQPLLDYEKNILLPNHDKAKNDVLSKVAAVKPQQAKVLREYTRVFNGIALDIDESLVSEVKKSPFVKDVYPNLEVKTNLNESVPLIGADKVWQLKDTLGKNITGEGINIAVLDTGVDYTHPDLGNTQITERNFVFSTTSDVPDIASDQQFVIDNNRIIWIRNSVSLGNQTILGIYKFGDTSIESIILANPPNMIVKRLAAKDNYIVYFGTTQIQSETGLYIYDLNTRTNRLIAAAGLVGNISISNGKVVYLRSKSADLADLQNIGVYVYDIQAGNEVLIEAGSFGYLENPFLSNNLVAYSNSGCSSRVVIYDLNNQTKREISLATSGNLIDFKGDQILYFSCSTTVENKFYLDNIVTGKSTTVSPPNLAGTPSSTPIEIKDTSSVGISFTFLEKGSIQDGIIYFTKNPTHNKVMAYDQIQNRYVQINLLSTSGAIAAEGKTICFRSSDTSINCHVYDSNYNYPIPAEIFNNKVIGGYNFIDNSKDPFDDFGHGTHVAAITAGNGTIKGIAPNGKIIAYKVLNYAGSGSYGSVIAALDQVVQSKMDSDPTNDISIVNLSLGTFCDSLGIYNSNCGPDDPLSTAVDRTIDATIVAIVAAGNDGSAYRTINSPGTSRKAITIGAVDKNKQLASFSSRGPVVYNGETINKPDVVAPGVSICAAEWDSWLMNRRCLDDKHIAIDGTSMATPHVAGLAALIKQVNPNLTPLQIKDIIKNTAQDLGLSIDEQGKGLIDSIKSVSSLFPKRVFVTSTTYNGNLGGLTGADSKCQARADAVSLGGIWKAWLSDSTSSPASRFIKSTGPYLTVDGTVIADNWNALAPINWKYTTDPYSLKNPINKDEYGNPVSPRYVWTNTLPNGNVDTSDHCQNWSYSGSSYSYYGGEGRADYLDYRWTYNISSNTCNYLRSLYCFEQDSVLVPTPTPIPTPIPTPTPTPIPPTPVPTPTPTPLNCPTLTCDLNGDGRQNKNDGKVVTSCLNKPATGTCWKVDVVCDGVINTLDRQKLVSSCPKMF